MIDPGCINSDQVLIDPSVLESADNTPSVGLLWFAATSSNAPASRDIVKEVWVLDSMRPNMFDRKLWPPDDLDLFNLGVGKKLLSAFDHILKKVERGVVQRREEHVLQERVR